jgi:hypothetical protein
MKSLIFYALIALFIPLDLMAQEFEMPMKCDDRFEYYFEGTFSIIGVSKPRSSYVHKAKVRWIAPSFVSTAAHGKYLENSITTTEELQHENFSPENIYKDDLILVTIYRSTFDSYFQLRFKHSDLLDLMNHKTKELNIELYNLWRKSEREPLDIALKSPWVSQDPIKCVNP